MACAQAALHTTRKRITWLPCEPERQPRGRACGPSAPSLRADAGAHHEEGAPLGGAEPGREKQAWALAFRAVDRAAGFM
eukprot:5245651-Pyramimonas_sp.AAC.1